MKNYLFVLLLALIIIPNIAFCEDPPTIAWVKTYDQGLDADDWGEDIAIDADGNVYVTGNVWRYGYNYSWVTIKYDADGNMLWYKLYDSGNGEDMPCAVEVDNNGNVYVVGYSEDNTIHDWRYIKYDADGNLLWDKTRDWGDDVDQRCYDAVLDTIGGYLYMIGEYIGNDGTLDYLTVKCDLDGNYIGENGWTGGSVQYNSGRSIALYQEGTIWYVYVTGIFGSSGLSWATIKYTANLSLEWSTVHNSGSDDHIPASGSIAVDYAGNAIVCGWSINTTSDWQIVKYNSEGNIFWSKVVDTGNDEGAWGVAVDPDGYIYVTGDFDTGAGWDCRTIKYDTNGNAQWYVAYDGGSNYDDAGRGVVVDDSGFVYVVGHSNNGNNIDYLTIKYAQQTGVEEQTPVVHSSYLNLQAVSNPTALPKFRYSLPSEKEGNLFFYYADGRKIEEFTLDPSNSTFTWNANRLPCGIYFARLVSDNHSVCTKICLTR
jgi:hypothetical protein